jgi:hypothetical protein
MFVTSNCKYRVEDEDKIDEKKIDSRFSKIIQVVQQASRIQNNRTINRQCK